MEIKPIDTVNAFIESLNKEDFRNAKNFLEDNFTFQGPMATRNGADEYMADMEKMKIKYKIGKSFENGDDVCLIYDVTLGVTMPTCGLYQVKNGKIKSLLVLFDPRPALEAKK